MASIDPIHIQLEQVLLDNCENIGQSFAAAERAVLAFGKSVSVTVPVIIHWTLYGRLKTKQLMGIRLTRRQRKHIWNLEHRGHSNRQTHPSTT